MPRRSRSPEPRDRRRHDSRDDYDDRDSKRRRRDRSRDERDHDREDRDEKQTVDSLESVGAKEISSDDYFQKAAEFRAWLREEKGKYIDELSGDTSRKYFKKFVKRWNGLTLPAQYYQPQASTSTSASAQTAYKWSFANNRSKVDKGQLAQLREDVDRMTNGSGSAAGSTSRPVVGPSLPPTVSRQMGPMMPNSIVFSANHADRQLALENQQEERARARKAERDSVYNRANEIVPKSGGREGKMEEKRATNAENRQYRERDATSGFEVDESTLMGGGNDFKKALAQRDAANARRQDRRGQVDQDRRSGMSERLNEMKSKDDQTMAMFRQMAQARFGTGGS